MRLPAEAADQLLTVARRSLEQAAAQGRPFEVDLAGLAALLAEEGASFVTLYQGDHLRGCIGTLDAYRPLAMDVAENACAAALRDPRFTPITPAELSGTHLAVTVIGESEPVAVASEGELLDSLRPGIDGVTLELGEQRATFLPAVWEQLPAPADFLAQLRRKAGLPPDFWSESLRFSRYQTHSYAEQRV